MNPKAMARKVLKGKAVRPFEEAYRRSRVYALQAKAGFPAKHLRVIAVTGTNGKTTTCVLINAMLKNAGYKTALFTTALIEIDGEQTINRIHRTVPVTSELIQFLHSAKTTKTDFVILETTSQALHQHKMAAIPVEVAVMTNLTQDHLDYHSTMENYAKAKARLFNSYMSPKHCVLNRDDEWFEFFKDESTGQVLSYGKDAHSSLKMTEVSTKSSGSLWQTKGVSELALSTHLPGLFNVYNATAAAAVGAVLGLNKQQIEKGIASLSAVPGRMQAVEAGQSFKVFVDYAHAPDALANVLKTLRQVTPGKVHVVFGATGDRDKSKRPIMGQIAAELADKIYLTDDEPYSEDPATIRKAVLAGIEKAGGKSKTVEIGDRAAAIKEAFKQAKKDDSVLLAGLGHQDYRGMNEGKLPWNEAEIAKKLLKN